MSIFASIFFGGLYILYLYLPTGMDHMEYQELYKMIPYIVTLVVLVLTSMRNKTGEPAAKLTRTVVFPGGAVDLEGKNSRQQGFGNNQSPAVLCCRSVL